MNLETGQLQAHIKIRTSAGGGSSFPCPKTPTGGRVRLRVAPNYLPVEGGRATIPVRQFGGCKPADGSADQLVMAFNLRFFIFLLGGQKSKRFHCRVGVNFTPEHFANSIGVGAQHENDIGEGVPLLSKDERGNRFIKGQRATLHHIIVEFDTRDSVSVVGVDDATHECHRKILSWHERLRMDSHIRPRPRLAALCFGARFPKVRSVIANRRPGEEHNIRCECCYHQATFGVDRRFLLKKGLFLLLSPVSAVDRTPFGAAYDPRFAPFSLSMNHLGRAA